MKIESLRKIISKEVKKMKVKKIVSILLSMAVFMLPYSSGVALADNQTWTSGGSAVQHYNFEHGMMVSVHDAVKDQDIHYVAEKQWKVTQTEPNGAETLITEFIYDADGNLINVIDRTTCAETLYDNEGRAIFDVNGQGAVTAIYVYDEETGVLKEKRMVGHVGTDVGGDVEWVDLDRNGKVDADEEGYAVVKVMTFNNGKQDTVRELWGQDDVIVKDPETGEIVYQEDEEGNILTDPETGDALPETEKKWVPRDLDDSNIIQRYIWHGNALVAIESLSAGEVTSVTVMQGGREMWTFEIGEGDDVSYHNGRAFIVTEVDGQTVELSIRDEMRDRTPGEGTVKIGNTYLARENLYEGVKKVATVSYDTTNDERSPAELDEVAIRDLINAQLNADPPVTPNEDGKMVVVFAGIAIEVELKDYDDSGEEVNYNIDMAEVEESILTALSGDPESPITADNISEQDGLEINRNGLSLHITKDADGTLSFEVKDPSFEKAVSKTFYDSHGRPSHAVEYVYVRENGTIVEGGEPEVNLAIIWQYNTTGAEVNVVHELNFYQLSIMPKQVDTHGPPAEEGGDPTPGPDGVVDSNDGSVEDGTAEFQYQVSIGGISFDVAIANPDGSLRSLASITAEIENRLNAGFADAGYDGCDLSGLEVAFSTIDEISNLQSLDIRGVTFMDEVTYQAGASMCQISFHDSLFDPTDPDSGMTTATVTYYDDFGSQAGQYDFKFDDVDDIGGNVLLYGFNSVRNYINSFLQ